MPSAPVRSFRPLAQSAFMNSVMVMRSLGRRARSPASEGVYSYSAEAEARDWVGWWEYAGGGMEVASAGVGCGE